MIGSEVTLVRVKDFGRGARQTFTMRGKVTDVLHEDDGRLSAVTIIGRREEDGSPVHSWYALCKEGCMHAGASLPTCGIRGSLIATQTATRDACGHPVERDCDCETIEAEAADQG